MFARTKNSAYSKQMKMYPTLLLLLLSLNGQAALYKSIDADGQVTYSDRPNLKSDQPLLLPSQNVIQSIKRKQPKQADTTTPTQNIAYQSLSILSPKNDSALRSNNGNLSLTLQLEPKLQEQHQLQILLDGSEVKRGTSLHIMLPNVSRGQHSLSAQVLDENNRSLIRSQKHTIYLQRHSKLF